MKKRTYISAGLFIVAVAIVTIVNTVRTDDDFSPPANNMPTCERVISLAPSITEMLFALGLGDKVVGVTNFCDYPAAALTKPNIGGYADPNYELILKSNPDLTFLLNLHKKQQEHLKQLKIETITLNADTIDGIIGSIIEISQVCNVPSKGEDIVNSMRSVFSKIKKLTKNKKRPRVLISIGRSMGSNSIQEIFVAGKKTFFNEVIELAGGTNAVENETVMYPRLSAEGVIAINPEIIIDLIVDMKKKDISVEDIIKQWHIAASTDAVINHRVHVLSQDYVVIPGPRVVLLVEQIAKLLHPDLNWSSQ